jgi:hypothetical protein
MEKRVRSPNYPALSLPEALEKVRMVFERQHTHGAPREVVVKSMGYAGINGASATAISALHKFGLLEGRGDEVRISDRAMRYLNPMSEAEREEAIRAAAYEPVLYRELSEKFPGRLPSEDVLRSYLIRNGFGPGAVSGIILGYRQTMELVDRPEGAYDSAQAITEPERAMPSPSPVSSAPAQAGAPMTILDIKGNLRSLGRLDFPSGGFVQIVFSGAVDEEDALDGVDTLVNWTRKQLAKRTGDVERAPRRDIGDGEIDGEQDA